MAEAFLVYFRHSIYLLMKYDPPSILSHPSPPSNFHTQSSPPPPAARSEQEPADPLLRPISAQGRTTKNLINCCFGFKPSTSFICHCHSATVQIVSRHHHYLERAKFGCRQQRGEGMPPTHFSPASSDAATLQLKVEVIAINCSVTNAQKLHCPCI